MSERPVTFDKSVYYYVSLYMSRRPYDLLDSVTLHLYTLLATHGRHQVHPYIVDTLFMFSESLIET
jgi:hypothetical protein